MAANTLSHPMSQRVDPRTAVGLVNHATWTSLSPWKHNPVNCDGGVFRDRTNYVLVGTFSRLALVGVTGVVGVEGLPTLYLSVSFHLPVSCGLVAILV